MTLDDLQRELGRSICDQISLNTEKTRCDNDYKTSQLSAQTRHQEVMSDIENQEERIGKRTRELLEAIRLVGEGVDPLLAKLKASESLDDRELAGESATDISVNSSGQIKKRLTTETWARASATAGLASRITSIETAINAATAASMATSSHATGSLKT